MANTSTSRFNKVTVSREKRSLITVYSTDDLLTGSRMLAHTTFMQPERPEWQLSRQFACILRYHI
jgi:hypothetical protein